MLTVTDSACATINDMLESNNAPQDVALRLTPTPSGGLGLAPDKAADADTTFDHEGRTVLVIAPDLAAQLDQITIDTEQGENGPQLAIKPQAQAG